MVFHFCILHMHILIGADKNNCDLLIYFEMANFFLVRLLQPDVVE